MDSLPVLPGAQARALALVHDPNVEIAAVASVVESDPAITSALPTPRPRHLSTASRPLSAR